MESDKHLLEQMLPTIQSEQKATAPADSVLGTRTMNRPPMWLGMLGSQGRAEWTPDIRRVPQRLLFPAIVGSRPPPSHPRVCRAHRPVSQHTPVQTPWLGQQMDHLHPEAQFR